MNIQEMSAEELENYVFERLQAINDIKSQLEHAKAGLGLSNKEDNAEWHLKAGHALRMKGLEHQRAQTELARRRKADRRVANRDINRYIVEEMKPFLSKTQFTMCVALAEERFENERGTGAAS